MRNPIKGITFILSFIIANHLSHAQENSSPNQLKWGIHSMDIAVSNTQYGVPFLRFLPVHPGGELGITFLKTENNKHRFTGTLGYFYHDLLAHAPYLKATYRFQHSIGDIIGLNATAGGGYAHVIHPKQGYAFDETTQTFISKTNHSPFVTAHLGFGVSLLTFDRVQPFIHYDAMMVGSIDATTANFRIGTTINF